jgi:anti-anti-sigma regulatory factor
MRTTVRTHRDRTGVLVSIQGILDGSAAAEVEQVLRRTAGRYRGKTLIVDFGRTRKFEYFGIVILSRVIRRYRHSFQEVRLSGMRTSVQNVFRRFGVERFDCKHKGV